MRLVDREHRNIHMHRKIEKRLRHQPLRRHVNDWIAPLARIPKRLIILCRRQRTVQIRRMDARLIERRDLILHQGNQRRHHQRDARKNQCRNLITQRFSAARRHDTQNITPIKNPVNQRFLSFAEAVISEIPLENFIFFRFLIIHVSLSNTLSF